MRTTRTPPNLCPYCGHAFNAASDFKSAARPKSGDFGVCIECAQTLVFDQALRMRKPHEGEIEAACKISPALRDKLVRQRIAIQMMPKPTRSIIQH